MKKTISLLSFDSTLNGHITAMAVNYNPQTTWFDELYCNGGHCFDSNINPGDCWAGDYLSNHGCANIKVYRTLELEVAETDEDTILVPETETKLLPKYAKFKKYLIAVVEYYQQTQSLSGFSIYAIQHHCAAITKHLFYTNGLDKMKPEDITDELVVKLRDLLPAKSKDEKNG